MSMVVLAAQVAVTNPETSETLLLTQGDELPGWVPAETVAAVHAAGLIGPAATTVEVPEETPQVPEEKPARSRRT